ncbi:MAG: DegV family protein [Dehalococcoidia bacterium]|nr:DegV family protein [Dehalococcoidia bacterium]
MTVKIVTDSSADIPAPIIKKLGIVVIPQHLNIGKESYRDYIDITPDEFYARMVKEENMPTTSQPTPGELIKLYAEDCKDADGIVVIPIGSKFSGTIVSAEQAAKTVAGGREIAVVDSQMVTIAAGILVIAAASMAKEGKSVSEIVAAIEEMRSHVKCLVLFDTLEYLARGGRIGKARSLVGSLLNVKPLLTIKDGEFTPVTQVRNRHKGKEKLLEFANAFKDVEECWTVYSTTKDEASELTASIRVVPQSKIQMAQLGAVVGMHAGPGVLAVAVRTKS